MAATTDPRDGYWQAPSRTLGVDYDLVPMIETTVDKAGVKASYDGGLVVVRREDRILGYSAISSVRWQQSSRPMSAIVSRRATARFRPGKRAVGQFAGLPVVGHTGQRPDDAHLVGTAQLSAPPVRPDSGRTATLAVVDRPLSRRLYQARRAIRCSTDRRMFPPIPATGWKPRLKRSAAAAAPGVVGHRSDGLTQPVAIHVNPSI
ncbi:hypothetical protein AA2016_5345 [Aminobacter aminovorans]|uniref:Uncharacterized protein n=3 Tax=Aminobacter TaxID=31988 RepID=A0AAC9ATI1_AMIAI|nr:hypothetical protein AA2016_5345 [Aminobacter aminovorans]